MIRHAKIDDAQAIRLIATITWAQAYDSMIPKDVQEQYIEEYYSINKLTESIKDNIMLVATEDDLIVGYLSCKIKGDVAYLLAMYVLPTNQRSGIGTILFDNLLKELSTDVRKIIVEIEVGNNMAEDFYLRQDFEKGDAGYGEIMGHPLKTVSYEKKI